MSSEYESRDEAQHRRKGKKYQTVRRPFDGEPLLAGYLATKYRLQFRDYLSTERELSLRFWSQGVPNKVVEIKRSHIRSNSALLPHFIDCYLYLQPQLLHPLTPYHLLPPDMADRRPRSGGRSSVRMVVSDPDTATKSSSASIRKDVTLRARHDGRLGQSVSHTGSEEASNDTSGLPLLLDLPDDEDEDNDERLANAMEEEFFGPSHHEIPAEKVKNEPVGA